MNSFDQDTFALDNFTGPLSFLLHLIQKHEIAISDVPIHSLTAQYLNKIKELLTPSVDSGAEFIGTTAFLLYMKSKMLLPKHEQINFEEEELDPAFEIIHKLLAYCRIKESAKDLGVREMQQSAYFPRGAVPMPEIEKGLGIEHIDLEDFAKIFRRALDRAPKEKGKITEEEYRVSDKIKYIRAHFQQKGRIPFHALFTAEKSKAELIVTFLAILELMKLGEGVVGRDESTGEVVIALRGEES